MDCKADAGVNSAELRRFVDDINTREAAAS
jgi:hypothetical protein